MHALYRGEANEDEGRPGGSCHVARANTPQQRRGASEAPESEDDDEDEDEDEVNDKGEENNEEDE